MTREQILNDCPEGYEDWIKTVLDHIEGRVNDAKRLLAEIKSISDLEKVEECRAELAELSRDLY